MVAQTASRDQFFGYDGRIYKNEELNTFGTYECINYRERILSRYSGLASAMRAEYLSIAREQSYVQANLRFLELDERLRIRDFNLLSDREEINELAQRQADHCRRLKERVKDSHSVFTSFRKLAGSYQIESPKPEDYGNELAPCINRFCCERWWKRQLTKKQKFIVESVSRELRQVHSHRSSYCSNFSFKRHKQQKVANRQYLESKLAVNEEKQEYTLAELSDLGVSNPAIRRLELITRCKGYEILAKELDHEALFITFTVPSRFHRMTKISGESGKVIKVIPNSKFDGSNPKDAQSYLCSTWAKIQAKFHREGIRPYGFRVAEPHHDGTPHWHFLLFVEKDHSEEMISIFQRWALKDTPDEKGAIQHRVKIEKIKTGITPNTGREYSATGYIIKYISKNIDGHGINNGEKVAQNTDWDSKDPYETAERIEAWARTNRIRQFQPIGGPSVTVWRELRRLTKQEGIVEQVRQAADSGDWASFVKAMGGPNIPREKYLARPTYALSESLDFDTGEITRVTHTCYGDEAKDRVVGILIHGMTILSRTRFWQIKESEKVNNARQKIMDGIADILEEIQQQNQHLSIPVPVFFPQQAKPAALDLFQ